MSLQKHDTYERVKHMRRPKKTPAERARRRKMQKLRLVALGVPLAVADTLSPLEIRNQVVRPARVKRDVAAGRYA